MLKRYCLFILSICLIQAYTAKLELNAAVYYVSSSKGNDKASGKAATAAWRTLKHACSRLGSNDTLMVFRGSVFREANISVNSGTIQAFGPANIPLPVLAGSLAFRKWEEADHNNKIYVTDCDQHVKHLFCDGQMLHIARYPNTGWLRSDTGNNASQINASALAKHPRNKAGYWNGANVRWRRWSWWFETRIIQNWDGNKALRLAGNLNTPNHSGDGSGFYMDNKFEELDAPGEWFYDAAAKKLYVYPPKDVDINSVLIEGMVHDKGIDTRGATIKQLEVRHFSDKGISINGKAIIDGCVFRGINTCAVGGSWDANGAEIKNCLFEDCLNVGISWNENAANKSQTSFHHNTFNRIGYVPGYGGSGVWHASAMIVSNANGLHIHHNRVDRVGYCGVILGRPNQIVEYNVFRRCMSTLNDGGAIYTNCDASIIRHNIVIESIGENLISSHKWANLGQGIWPEFLEDFKDTKIINNTIVNCGCHGIFLGNNYNCEITGNVIFGNRNGLFLNGRAGKPPQNHQINNNTFVSMGNDQTPILFRTGYNYGSMTGNLFANPYGTWVASNGNNWGRGHMPLESWQKDYQWSDKGAKTFIGKVSSTSKSALGRPHCFINDTDAAVDIPIKGTWYTVDKQEFKGSVHLEPFTSAALILGKGNPGKLNGDFTLASELNKEAAASTIAAKPSRKSRKKDSKEKETEKKTSAKKSKPTVSEEVAKAWMERLKKELASQLASGKHPYFEFMAKQYRVDELSDGKTLKISSGSQSMTYPIDRLKAKDACALAVGMSAKSTDEAKCIAAFYLLLQGNTRKANSIMMKLGKEHKEELKALGF